MKTFLLAPVVMVATLTLAPLAHAKPYFYKIDLRGERFKKHTEINLFDDGLSEGLVAYEILFDTDSEDADYEVEALASDEETVSRCEIRAEKHRGTQHAVRIMPWTEIDEIDSKCTVEIRFNDGRVAKVEFYSVGT